jgi:hypothetical protein
MVPSIIFLFLLISFNFFFSGFQFVDTSKNLYFFT